MPAIVTTRRYGVDGIVLDPEVSSISMGLYPPFSVGGMLVIDTVISGVQSAGNLGFGITSADFGDPQVSDVLRYAIVSDPAEFMSTPVTVIPGLSGQDGIANVINVGFRARLESNYVVLYVVPPGKPMGNCCFTVKWFFGYAMKE